MKQNNTHILLAAAMLTLLSFGSCKKDTVTLRAKISHFNGSKVEGGEKVYLDANTPRWNNGDTIKINEGPALISTSNEQIATIEVPSASRYTAVYPASIATDLTNSSAAQLTLPRLQVYREDDNQNQIVATPMCASSSGTTLTFKNMGALLAIDLVNNAVHAGLTIDSVSVRSVAYGSTGVAATAMWGPATANPTSEDPSYSFTATPTAGVNDSVTLAREGNQSLNIVLSTDTMDRKKVYVYVPAVSPSANNLFCIRIFANVNNAGYTYVKTQHTSGSGNIGRNQKAEVTFTMRPCNEHKFVVGAVSGGLFTVTSRGLQVYFSKGNLQYRKKGRHSTINGGSATGTWRFAENQWDYLGDIDYRNIGDETWFDLFGYGTSGYDVNPYEVSRTGYPTSHLISSYDWGTYNAISNGGNVAGLWFTLLPHEWLYLLNTRIVNGGQGEGHCYQLMKVHSIQGLLIYPDGYTQQSSYNSSSNPSAVPDGCVFLPAAGHREQSSDQQMVEYCNSLSSSTDATPFGEYWTSYHDADRPYQFNFDTSVYISLNYPEYGLSVRLVRNDPYTTTSSK